jgi:hypothetical protein
VVLGHDATGLVSIRTGAVPIASDEIDVSAECNAA